MGRGHGEKICTSVTWGLLTLLLTVTLQGVNTFKEPGRNSRLEIGGTDWDRTSDLALMKRPL